VHPQIDLSANFPIDAGAVRNRIAAQKSASQFLRVGQVGFDKTRFRQLVNGFVAHILATRDQHRLVSSRH